MLGAALLDLLDGGDASALVDGIAAALSTTPPKALERSAALLIWKRQWDSANTASRHGGDRRSHAFKSKDQDEKISFCSMAAKAIGMGERSVQLDVALAEQLGPADIKRLWGGPIHDNAAALKTVAALGVEARTTLFSVWADKPGLGFSAALRAARLREDADADEEQFGRLLDAWTRAGSKARRRFLDEIGVAPQEASTVIARWRKRGAET